MTTQKDTKLMIFLSYEQNNKKMRKKMFQKQSLYRVIYTGQVCCENASKRENVMLALAPWVFLQ